MENTSRGRVQMETKKVRKKAEYRIKKGVITRIQEGAASKVGAWTAAHIYIACPLPQAGISVSANPSSRWGSNQKPYLSFSFLLFSLCSTEAIAGSSPSLLTEPSPIYAFRRLFPSCRNKVGFRVCRVSEVRYL